MSYQPTDAEVRHRRDRYLQASDLYIMADRWDTYTSDERQAWSVYRQSLRDLPQQKGFPTVVEWPVPPVIIPLEKPEGWPESWL